MLFEMYLKATDAKSSCPYQNITLALGKNRAAGVAQYTKRPKLRHAARSLIMYSPYPIFPSH